MDVMRRWIVCGILVYLAVVFPASTFGDGKGFPLSAIPKAPDIPQQRAIIAWNDGVETLVVESTFDTKSEDVGWVLPLPVKPTQLAQASPGMLKSMSMSLRPRITTKEWNGLDVLVPILLAYCIIALFCTIFREIPFRFMVYLFVIFGLFCSMFTTSLGRARNGRIGSTLEGITVLSSDDVGNYTASVLQAKSPDALSDWLKTQGLKTLDDNDKKVVAEYIQEKWVFVVAKLRKGEEGMLTPHPIQATFPAKAPIYPMKLTALAGGGKTRVELAVIAQQQAQVEGFETIVSDTFERVTPQEDAIISLAELQPYYQSKETDVIIGQPDMQKLLWPGCVVTKLNADMTPKEMQKDIVFTMKSCSPFRLHFYSADARKTLLESIGLLGAIITVVLLAVILRRGREPGNRSKELLIPLAVLIVTFAVNGAIYAALPVRPTTQGRRYSQFGWEIHSRSMSIGMIVASEEGTIKGFMSDEELKAVILKIMKEWHGGVGVNPFTQNDMSWERSPGNFWILREHGNTYFCMYDYEGREYRIDLEKSER